MPHLPPITVSSNGHLSVDFPVSDGMECHIARKNAETSSIDIDQGSTRIYRINVEQMDGSVVAIVPKAGLCSVKVYIAHEEEPLPETAAEILALRKDWEHAESTAL